MVDEISLVASSSFPYPISQPTGPFSPEPHSHDISPKAKAPPLPTTDDSPSKLHPPRQTPFWNASSTPRPPTLRNVHSSVILPSYPPHLSPTEMMRTGSDPQRDLVEQDRMRTIERERERARRFEDEKEELTTKGRKRKRLAKACSACHKNKRRCDGFAPCSNCEFSSRPCLYLNAQGEPIPPPRTRDSSISPVDKKDDKPDFNGNNLNGNNNGKDGDGDGPSRRGSDDRDRKEDVRDWERGSGRSGSAPTTPIDAVERDPGLSAELVDIFIRRVPPYSTIFHLPTLYHRIYTSSISPVLLDVIYALAARLCENPTFLATFPAQHSPWLRGDSFAERAQLSVDRIVEARRKWTDDERKADRGSWEETEFVQALCLLSLYGNCLRRIRQALYFLDIGLSILRPDHPSAPLPSPSAHLHAALGTLEYLTLVETRNRTFWMLVLGDLCVSTSGRPRRLMDHEMSGVPMPGKEEYWTRYGGGGSTDQVGVRDGLVHGSAGIKGNGTWTSSEAAVGELGHVLRILSIFCDIMSVANGGSAGAPDTRQMPASQHEHALKSWAINLPPSLRFNETNLCLNIAKIHSPLPQTSVSGWLYAYMHAIAECGMFYLQAAAMPDGNGRMGHPPPGIMAQRQGQAVDNLAVILHSLGEKGREGPLMLFPILVVSNWQDHLKTTSNPSTPSISTLDERISLWWGEVYREWGFEREPVQDRGGFFYAISRNLPESKDSNKPSPRSSASERRFSRIVQSSPSSLGLYQGPSPTTGQAPFDDSNNGAAINLPTPVSASSSRYLPPIRPRAASSTFPQHRLFEPTTPERRTHIPSLTHEHPTPHDAQRMSLPSLSAEFGSFHSTERMAKTRSYNGDGSQYVASQNEHRPPSPRSGRSVTTTIGVEGMSGIAALLSAAEETQQERVNVAA